MNNQNSKDNNKKKSNGNHNDENDEINFHGDRTERNNVQGKDKSNNKKRPYPFNCMDVPIPGKVRKGRRHGGQSNIETVGKSATPSGSIQHDVPRGGTTVFFVKYCVSTRNVIQIICRTYLHPAI